MASVERAALGSVIEPAGGLCLRAAAIKQTQQERVGSNIRRLKKNRLGGVCVCVVGFVSGKGGVGAQRRQSTFSWCCGVSNLI